MRRILIITLAITGAAVLAIPRVSGDGAPAPETKAPAADTIDFNRQILPILSDNCFACHGPDENQRKAKLRLDTKEGAFAELRRGGHAIVAGDSAKSDLLMRVADDDDKIRMPPPKTGKRLTKVQIDLLKRWIDQGARWSAHWSLVKPERPALPAVKGQDWVRTPIDRFILARLEKEGLRPSTEAEKVTLIRRVTLDLTGLPPTPAEVDAFLADSRSDAYERLVDRLLSSPRYGERMALEWLDASRYADTHGYHIDSGRDMTRWREWVIDAFNHNKPFDQFTVEQIAGDLLPGATVEQKVASGFNRNHMINFEGGAIPAEYHNAYIVDRVNTTATVWLGLTVACAQCHDHKYDPITQKEFYQLYAFFHNVPENGLDGSKGNAAPMLRVPTRQQQLEMDRLNAAIRKAEDELNRPRPDLDAEQARWEKTAAGEKVVEWSPMTLGEVKAKGGAKFKRLGDGSVLAAGANPATDTYTIVARTKLKEVTAIRLEALPDDSLKGQGPGRSVNGNIVLTDVRLATRAGDTDTAMKIRSASADFSQQDFPIANAIDDQPQSGWAIHPEMGKPHFAIFEAEKAIRPDAEVELVITLDFQSQFGQHQLGRFRVSATGASDPHGGSALPETVRAALAVAADNRTDAQKADLRRYYRSKVATTTRPVADRLARMQQELAVMDKTIPTAMVMQEMAQPRETFVLVRGQYDKKGEQVTAGVPASLPPLPKGTVANRLGLAKWLVDPAHPLTARVTVNRYWQMYFGTGLVETAEDFGVQGLPPSHPELLDWLATEFIRTGWDVRAMQRLIVTSATYRQSASIADFGLRISDSKGTEGASSNPQSAIRNPQLVDPGNRLLARMPRLRLQAEFIRDQALVVSGLLNGEIGGASVFPYQPRGLWSELASRQDGANWTAQEYTPSKGKELYRRSMYTFWKRTSPPPTMLTFDAPDRETCSVRRARTNTPLQALILMNDPTYVEASRKLAERLMNEATTTDERIALAFRLATGRKPETQEVTVLKRIYDKQITRYRNDRAAAVKLLKVGESKYDERLDAAELAAWAMVANVILNLDETVTRG